MIDIPLIITVVLLTQLWTAFMILTEKKVIENSGRVILCIASLMPLFGLIITLFILWDSDFESKYRIVRRRK